MTVTGIDFRVAEEARREAGGGVEKTTATSLEKRRGCHERDLGHGGEKRGRNVSREHKGSSRKAIDSCRAPEISWQ